MPVHREDCGCLVHRGNCGRCMGSKCLVLPPQAPALMLTASLTLMASPPHRFQGLCFLLPYHPAPFAGLLDIGPSAIVASHPLGVKNTAPAQGSGRSTQHHGACPSLPIPTPTESQRAGLTPFSILTAIPGGQAPGSSPPEGQWSTQCRADPLLLAMFRAVFLASPLLTHRNA